MPLELLSDDPVQPKARKPALGETPSKSLRADLRGSQTAQQAVKSVKGREQNSKHAFRMACFLGLF